MSTKTTTAKSAAIVTVPAPKKATPARKKTGSPAAEAKKAQTALQATALEFTPAELVKRLTAIRTSNDTTATQVEEFRNMFEAAKLQASNQRVLLARNAYLLATHKDVATKRYPVFYGGAAKVMAGPEATTKEIDALRKWITAHVDAGSALQAKGLVWNQVDPTEAERAIVEGSHDAGVRAESAKKNEKVRNKLAGKGKGESADKGESEDETDGDGILKSKAETVIPTAEGIISALETIRKNITRFHAEARFTELEAAKGKEQIQLILADLMGFYPDEDDADTDGE